MIDVAPGLPADKAGLAPGMKLVGVNSRKWTPEVLHDAVKGTATTSGPLELLIEQDDFFKTFRLDYHGGDASRTCSVTIPSRTCFQRSLSRRRKNEGYLRGWPLPRFAGTPCG